MKNKGEQTKHKATSTFRRKLGIRLAIIIFLVLLLRGFAFTSCLISSTNMENSILQNERILVNKWSYGLRVPCMSLFSYHRWCEKSVKRQDVVVFNNPASIHEPIVDQRETYISRCIATPGDTLWVDSIFSATPNSINSNTGKRVLYNYPATKESLITLLVKTLSINNEGVTESGDSLHTRSFNFYEFQLLKNAIHGEDWIQAVSTEEDNILKPLIIPSKGKPIRVYPWNVTLLRNTLVMHEGKNAEIKNDTLFIDGQAAQHCYFTQDYYWMKSDKVTDLTDSRLFGLVPQNHIIGKAWFVWFSKASQSGFFDGYRGHRFFHRID